MTPPLSETPRPEAVDSASVAPVRSIPYDRPANAFALADTTVDDILRLSPLPDGRVAAEEARRASPHRFGSMQ